MSMVMVFDIETVPDVEQGRRLLELQATASDKEVRDALIERRLKQTQGSSDFLPHYLQKIVAISVVARTEDWVKVWSLGDESSSEKELVLRFFQGLERYTPWLVSWNGGGFDLPVLHYRALYHSIACPRYWDTGENDPQFKWNNYLSRFHQRHTDLMDVLAGFQTRANAPLDEIAKMLGFPGKMGMKGSEVLEQFENQNLKSIRDYCETDVLNTYLVFLRYQFLRGQLNEETLAFEENRLREHLKMSEKPHLLEFLELWGVEKSLNPSSC
jgi:predicted PolB exonuclease-like 3'-5' exonuclease